MILVSQASVRIFNIASVDGLGLFCSMGASCSIDGTVILSDGGFIDGDSWDSCIAAGMLGLEQMIIVPV